jgi:uncharacterized protein YggU (UPF0235/DUF167 family)
MNLIVKVKPKARDEKVEKIDDTHYVIYTKNIPEKGRANEGVIQLLSKHFSVPKSRITIISGKTSRLKGVLINI